MVLPELSRTMAYINPEQSTDLRVKTTLIFIMCTWRNKSIKIELEKHNLDQIAAKNVRVFLEKCRPFPRLKRLRRKTYEDK